jgi:hypothetical protein
MSPEGDLLTTLGRLEPGDRRGSDAGGDPPSARMLQVAAEETPSSDMQGAAVVDASGAVLGLTTWSDDQRFYVAPIDVAGKVAAGLMNVSAPGS